MGLLSVPCSQPLPKVPRLSHPSVQKALAAVGPLHLPLPAWQGPTRPGMPEQARGDPTEPGSRAAPQGRACRLTIARPAAPAPTWGLPRLLLPARSLLQAGQPPRPGTQRSPPISPGSPSCRPSTLLPISCRNAPAGRRGGPPKYPLALTPLRLHPLPAGWVNCPKVFTDRLICQCCQLSISTGERGKMDYGKVKPN